MKRLFLFLLLLVMVLIGGILIGPEFVDWNRQRGLIAAQLTTLAGRPVTIDGPLSVRMVPGPTVIIEQVSVANPPGAAEPVLFAADKLELHLALAPLLSGQIVVEKFALTRPVAHPEILPDGSPSWPVLAADPAGRTGLVGRLLGAARLDLMAVTDGRIGFRDRRDGRTEAIEGITVDVVANSLSGPFQIKGVLVARGQGVRGDLTTGRFASDGTLPVRLVVGLEPGESNLYLAGMLTPRGEKAGIAGEIRLEGPDLGPLAAALAALSSAPDGEAWATELPKAPFLARASVQVDGRRLEATDLTLRLGDSSGTGSLVMAFGAPAQGRPLDLAAKLAFHRLDLEPWGTLTRRLAAGAVGVPAGITGRLDLTVDALGLRGGVLRQGVVTLGLAERALTVEQLSVLGPGGSDLSLSGTLAVDSGGTPAGAISLEVSADNLRGVLDWLNIEIPGVPQDRLRKVSLAAQAQGRLDDFQVSGLDLRFDTTRLIGGFAFRDNGRPGIGVRVEVDRFNWDAYRTDDRSGMGGADDGGGGGPESGPPATPQTLPWPIDLVQLAEGLGAIDAAVDARIGLLTIGGQSLEGLAIDGTLNRGSLTLRSARVNDLAGMAATAHGRMASVLPARGIDFQVTAQAADLGSVLRTFGHGPGPVVDRIGAVSLNGRATGDPEALAAELRMTAAGGTIDAGGQVHLASTENDPAPTAELQVRATYPGLVPVVRLLLPDYQAETGDPGPFDLYAAVRAEAAGVSFGDIQGTVGGVSVRGNGRIDLGAQPPRVEADLQTGTLVVDRFLPAVRASGMLFRPAERMEGLETWSSVPLAWDWLDQVALDLGLTSAAVEYLGRRLVEPAVKIEVADGVLTLAQMDATLLGGRLAATGRLQAGEAGATADVALTLADTALEQGLFPSAIGTAPVDLTRGLVDLDLRLATRGSSWAAMMGALDGTGRIVVENGVLAGFDLGAVAEAVRRFLDRPEASVAGAARPEEVVAMAIRHLQSGSTAISQAGASFVITKGILRCDDLQAVAEGGVVNGRGTVTLADRSAELALMLGLGREPGQLPPVLLTVVGPWERLQRAVELTALQALLIERAAAATIRQLNPGAAGPPPGATGQRRDGWLGTWP